VGLKYPVARARMRVAVAEDGKIITLLILVKPMYIRSQLNFI
jgi:hypothetical protein